MQETKVTVVIPNYNGIKYIRDCMDSLYKQEEISFEILVVDNGSKDGSLEILKTEYVNAKVIALEDNTGFCHAVNVGIQNSSTPYVILLNNDTVVKPGFVGALLAAIEESERIFSVSSMMLSSQLILLQTSQEIRSMRLRIPQQVLPVYTSRLMILRLLQL